MDEARYRILGFQALTEPRTASGGLQKVGAMDELCRSGMPIPVDRFRQDLIEILENPIDSYEGARLLGRARKLLDYIDDELPEGEHPSDTPDQLAPEGYWH